MKFAYSLLLLLLGSCVSTLTLYVGEAQLDDDAVDAVDEQETVALEGTWGILPFGFGLELGISQSSEDGSDGPIDIDSSLLEGYVGARKTFREDHRLRPYIAAGLSFVDAEFEAKGPGLDIDDDDFSEGVYARTGVGWHFALFHVGLDYRVRTGEGEFDGEDVDLDSGLLSIFGGLSF